MVCVPSPLLVVSAFVTFGIACRYIPCVSALQISGTPRWNPVSADGAEVQSPIVGCCPRRSLLAASAACATGLLVDHKSANADPMQALVPGGARAFKQEALVETDGDWTPSPLRTKLGTTRIQPIRTSFSPIQQLPFTSQELYFPKFLFGTWDVTATLKRKIYPFGKDFVPSNSLIEGSTRNRNEQVGPSSKTSYEVHYFSTLADTPANQMTVQLGLGVPQPKIIADRSFNTISTSKAYQQLTPVESVDWDYRAEPTRLTLRFGAAPLAADMRPLGGPRRTEVYLTARQSESVVDENTGGEVFAAAERSRSVTVGVGSVMASDLETITEYFRPDVNDPNTVSAVSRTAVYLTPNPNSREGVLWQQIGGQAVAFFDYELIMRRRLESFTVGDGSTVQCACVLTPKDVVQCE